MPFYDVYETSDGGWLAVGPLEQRLLTPSCSTCSTSPTAAPDRLDPASGQPCATLLADTFRTRTRDEWTAHFEDTDACVAPILELRRGARAPARRGPRHLRRARGRRPAGPGAALLAHARRADHPALQPGADTRAALAAWGIEDVDALIDSGAAVQT